MKNDNFNSLNTDFISRVEENGNPENILDFDLKANNKKLLSTPISKNLSLNKNISELDTLDSIFILKSDSRKPSMAKKSNINECFEDDNIDVELIS